MFLTAIFVPIAAGIVAVGDANAASRGAWGMTGDFGQVCAQTKGPLTLSISDVLLFPSLTRFTGCVVGYRTVVHSLLDLPVVRPRRLVL